MTPFNESMSNTTFTIIIVGFTIFAIVKGISTWNHNNAQPKLTVSATIVSKRENISTHMNNAVENFSHTNTNTTYFVTFEVQSGDRLEFHVNCNEYGLLAEQDKGNLFSYKFCATHFTYNLIFKIFI